MNGNKENARNTTLGRVSTDDIKSEPSKVESTKSVQESDSSDDAEEEIYKNLSKEQLHRARKYNECFICQKRCSSFANFRSHVFGHTKVQNYRCDKCFKEFAKLKYLNAHLTTHNENRVFTCEICSHFATKNSIRGHMRIHTGEKPYKCGECDRSFSESSTRRKHMLTHFPDKQKQTMEPCVICGKIMKGRDSIKRHMQIHAGVKNFECQICSKHFAKESMLRAHIVIHTDRPREHICKICSKGFYHRSSLWKHTKRPCFEVSPVFRCGMCAEIFKEKAAQIQGEEEGICKICGKILRTSRGLRIHLSKHMADKQFQCVICANKDTEGNLRNTFYTQYKKVNPGLTSYGKN